MINLYYQIGQSVKIVCIDSWKEYNNDYQVIAYTKIDDMKLMGIDMESIFIYKNQEELYKQFYEENRLFYILKRVQRNNFMYIDDNTIDNVLEYVYLCDDLIDFNNSEILTKRSTLNAYLYIGSFFSEELLDVDNLEITGYHKSLQDNLTKDLSTVLDNYSDSYIIDFVDKETVLQPLASALQEDSTFLEKRKQAELDAIERAKEEEEKKNYLIKKENFLLQKEKELNLLKAEAVVLQRKLDTQLEEIEKEKASLESSQNAVDRYEAYLTQKEAKLNTRAEKIAERENELGISNSNL